MTARRSMKRAAAALALLLSAATGAETFLPGEGDVEVSVYQTTARRPFRELPATPFTAHCYTNRAPIDVDGAAACGRYRGLGVSMTDSSCWVLSRMSPERRRQLLEAVFSPQGGAALGGIRLSIGASDYSTALYTYNDVPGDVEMRYFDISRDDRWVFPMVKEALAVNPGIFLFAASWSPPGWMKTTGNFVDGHFKSGFERAHANYLLAYARALKERGLSLGAVSVNNESRLSTNGTYPSCVFSGEQEMRIAELLAESFRREGLPTKVWAWDFDYGGALEAVPDMLADPGFRTNVGGVAFHSYSGDPYAVQVLKRRFPDVPFYHTEMGPALHAPERTERWWAMKMKDAFENGCETFTGWNLCLTEDGTPLVGPHLCAGLVTVDLESGAFSPSAQYNVFRHVGPFVRDGAEVLKVEGDCDGLAVMLFRNPDGGYVLVAVSEGHGRPGRPYEHRPKLYVRFNGEMAYLPLPHGEWAITTMVFRRRQRAAAECSGLAFPWRGFMLDEARHFFGKEKVKELLDLMEERKMNVFHWHLTDDQGWRVDLPGLPELVRYGAVRSCSPKRGQEVERDGTPYGPFFYSADDVREVVAYAAARGIDVVPELDVPGHCRALLAAHPEFACVPREELRDPRTTWGIAKDVLCIGNAQAVRYVERVIDRFCELFPSEYFHIGGDECPKDRWLNCPRCKTLTQASFTRHVIGYLASKGRTAICWDEVLGDAELPPSTVIQCWRGRETAVEAARLGHRVIVSPYLETYLSLPTGEEGDPWPYRKWLVDENVRLTRADVAAFDPLKGIPKVLRGKIIGGECCAWTEEIALPEELDFKVKARLSAFGDALLAGSSL